MNENPWIREHKGFALLYLGVPQPYTNIDNELGLVVRVHGEEDIGTMKKLFAEKLGSSTRWEDYPLYILKTKSKKLSSE